ncbi:MAG TPA: virulence factor [Gemmatimonadales bacterium]
MSSAYQVVYWRDIPAQVKIRHDGGRAARPLSDRFQAAIDEAAMHSGATDTDSYLEEWRSSDWQSRDGDPEALAVALVSELEAAYPPERLTALTANGGREG